MPDEQVQAPHAEDALWRLLFDRLDRHEEHMDEVQEDIRVLKEHVNEEQEKFTQLLATTVRKGEVLKDIGENVKSNRMSQLIISGVVVSMAPVVGANWSTLIESIKGAF